VTVHHELAIY